MVETVEPFAFWLPACIPVRVCAPANSDPFQKQQVVLNPGSYLQLSACLVLLGRNWMGVRHEKKIFLVEFWALEVPPSHPANQNSCK